MAAQNLSRSGMTQLASAAMQWLDGPRKRVPSDFGASPRVGYDASVQQRIGLGHGNESAFSLGAASGGSSGAPEGDEGYGVGPGYGMSQPNQPPYGPFHSPVPYSDPNPSPGHDDADEGGRGEHGGNQFAVNDSKDQRILQLQAELAALQVSLQRYEQPQQQSDSYGRWDARQQSSDSGRQGTQQQTGGYGHRLKAQWPPPEERGRGKSALIEESGGQKIRRAARAHYAAECPACAGVSRDYVSVTKEPFDAGTVPNHQPLAVLERPRQPHLPSLFAVSTLFLPQRQAPTPTPTKPYLCQPENVFPLASDQTSEWGGDIDKMQNAKP